MGDIRVFVTFPESTVVFAGETLQCKIVFKNTAPAPGSSRSLTQHGPSSSYGQNLGASLNDLRVKPGSRQLPQLDARRGAQLSPRIQSRPPSAHKQSLSFPVPPGKSSVPPSPGRQGNSHRRSVSIVSIGSDAGIEPSNGRGMQAVGERTQPTGRPRGHGRASSLHIVPRKYSHMSNGSMPNSALLPSRGTAPPTPMIVESETTPMSSFSFPAKPATASTPGTPYSPERSPHRKPQSAFKFPPDSTGSESLPVDHKSLSIDTNGIGQLNKKVSRIDLQSPVDEPDYEHISPGRIIPAHSINGETPRSSIDFYSMSNGTTESLASEYDPRTPPRARAVHNRRHSLLSVGNRPPDILMMGYAHVMGSFTVDGSLIQSSVFDETKRKGVVGTHMGGGVVGIDTNKNEGGFLGGFGWGSITGLLGSSQMSSMAEMKNMASTKSVPILSTPQSILFVDLRLAPGESRSYMYTFTLPKGLPPSHKGKAIKITYHVVIGTQRPGQGVKQPTVIEIPFRVFPNVYDNGSIDTHDLRSPIVLLRDEATAICLDEQASLAAPTPKKQSLGHEPSTDDFLSYVNELLAPKEDTSHLAILSPTIDNSKRLSIYEDLPLNSKDSIEMAILRGPTDSNSRQNNSMFEIARNGSSVATVTFARPAYKLGETITAVIDFSNATIPCYHINASLEFSETITPSVALRSASSIHRATRRIYIQHSESTLFAKRILFTPTIPSTATPEFTTSEISSAWIIRLEFITTVLSSRRQDYSPTPLPDNDDLLEQTYADDRGELFEPPETLQVESFDACIPVRVYPNAADPSIGAAVTAQLNPAGYVV